jgi:hypothetical protein
LALIAAKSFPFGRPTEGEGAVTPAGLASGGAAGAGAAGTGAVAAGAGAGFAACCCWSRCCISWSDLPPLPGDLLGGVPSFPPSELIACVEVCTVYGYKVFERVLVV